MNSRFILALALLGVQLPAALAGEREANQISAAIELRHAPGGVLLDPIYDGPRSDRVVAYTRGGDSAIWTGHYLAAEALRYAVTSDPDALRKVRKTVDAIARLTDATGTGLLARCVMDADWPGLASVSAEESHHGVYESVLDGRPVVWIGNTSRDQYLGVFFGLSLVYDLVDDAALRTEISRIVTALLDFLRFHDWAVRMPSGEISSVFWHRPDQRLMLLQVGRQVNPGRFGDPYERRRWLESGLVRAAVAIDLIDEHSSYFKFNLNAISLFTLWRLEDGDTARDRYRRAWEDQWNLIGGHGNPHFAAVDRVIRGADPTRDTRTVEALDAWLRRPRRDWFRDFASEVRVCGERACEPLPVEWRVTTDFLWQRSPFQLAGGGSGRIRGAGIDYLLPYWMLRYYGVLSPEPSRRAPTGRERTFAQ